MSFDCAQDEREFGLRPSSAAVEVMSLSCLADHPFSPASDLGIISWEFRGLVLVTLIIACLAASSTPEAGLGTPGNLT